MKQMGYVVGVFGLSLAFALIWLVISKIVPPLRERLGLSYAVAAVLAFVPSFISPHGPNVLNLIGPLLCVCLLFWQYRRDRKRLANANLDKKKRKGRKGKAKS